MYGPNRNANNTSIDAGNALSKIVIDFTRLQLNEQMSHK